MIAERRVVFLCVHWVLNFIYLMKGTTMIEELNNYTSRATRALVLLHEKHLRQCLEVWKQAKAENINLPVTGEEAYQSLENLLKHILDSGPNMVRICERLELPDPDIRDVPDSNTIEAEADSYVEHILARWRLPLVTVSDEKLEPTTYVPDETRWWIDGNLEHAVMHPIRHEFQLKELMQQTEELSNYTSRGARALVLLHEKHLRQCLAVWKEAKAANLLLPVTGEEKYQSLENLLSHILNSAGRYMMGMCKYLELPDPQIKPVPNLDVIDDEADSYLEHLLERWRLSLADVPDERLEPTIYISGETHYWIDVMLEHAAMHPIRHEFQLRELIEGQANG